MKPFHRTKAGRRLKKARELSDHRSRRSELACKRVTKWLRNSRTAASMPFGIERIQVSQARISDLFDQSRPFPDGVGPNFTRTQP